MDLNGVGDFLDLPAKSSGDLPLELEQRIGDGLSPRPLCLKERVDEPERAGERAPGL